MTSKAQLQRDLDAQRNYSASLREQLDKLYEANSERYIELVRFLKDLLVLDPDLERFRSGEDEYRDWDLERTHAAAEFARGHDALHSVEREPDIEIHLQEAAA